MVTATVCLVVVVDGLFLGAIVLLRPEVNISRGFAAIVNVINTLIGLLAGYLAGRTQQSLPSSTEDEEQS